MRIWYNRHFAVVARVVKLLREASPTLPLEVLVSHRHAHFVGYAYADDAFVEPAGLEADEYLAWCLKTAEERGVEVLVPGHEQSYLTQHAHLFEAIGCRVWRAAPPGILPNLHRKEWVYEHAAHLVALPEYRVADTPDQVREAVVAIERNGTIETCLKPCVSVYGKGYGRITAQVARADQARQSVDEWVRSNAQEGACDRQIVMEYLPGPEYSVDLAARNGDMLAAVVRQKPLTGMGQLLVDFPEMLKAARRLVGEFDLNGVINIQFRDHSDGGARLLEINPRASGGIGMSCMSGVNLPDVALRAFLDSDYAPTTRPVLGVRVAEVPTAVILPQTEPLQVAATLEGAA
jgi:biotin carboxylase